MGVRWYIRMTIFVISNNFFEKNNLIYATKKGQLVKIIYLCVCMSFIYICSCVYISCRSLHSGILVWLVSVCNTHTPRTRIPIFLILPNSRVSPCHAPALMLPSSYQNQPPQPNKVHNLIWFPSWLPHPDSGKCYISLRNQINLMSFKLYA